MYSKMFDLINNEINFIIDNTPKNTLELKKIEIKGIKVKLVFLDKKSMKVETRLYEFDLFGPQPKLNFKKDYVKPFNDKYFR